MRRQLRQAVSAHSGLNRVARFIWRLCTIGRPIERRRCPVIGRFRVKTAWGTLWMESSRPDDLSRELYWNGVRSFEPETMSIFLRLADFAETVLDVGANVGIFSMMAASRNPKARILAFEPEPAALESLRRNIALNGMGAIEVIPLALADVQAVMHLYVPSTAHGIQTEASLMEGFRPDCRAVKVRCETVDEYAKEHGLRIDLLKVDVETAEHRVFAGASRSLLRDRPPIISEVLFNTNERKIEEALGNLDYRFFWISSSGLVEQKTIDADPTYVCRNYLFLPSERADAILRRLEDARGSSQVSDEHPRMSQGAVGRESKRRRNATRSMQQ